MPDDGDERAGDRREALRRDLYRRGATRDEVERYRALPVVVPEPPQPVPRRRRAGVAAGGAVLVGAVIVAVLQPATSAVDAPPRLEAAPRALDACRVVTPYGATVPLPTPVAVSAEGEAAAGQRYRGSGGARFPVDTADAPQEDGRMVLRVVAVDGEELGWQLLRVDPAATPAEHRWARGPATDADGEPVTAVLDYRDGPPAIVELTAPAGARWTADVAFLPAEAPTLR